MAIKYRKDRLNKKTKEQIDNQIQIPHTTDEFLDLLEKWYPNGFETDYNIVNTSEYWKKAGVIDMVRKVRELLK